MNALLILKILVKLVKCLTNTLFNDHARGAMVKWLEWSLVKQEDLGSIPAQTKCFSSLLGYKEVGIKWIQTQQIASS